MELTKIKISGYKSIDDMDFAIEKRNGSYTTILLGKNETGKSNILDALALFNAPDDDKDVSFLNIRNQAKEPNIVSVFYSMKSNSPDQYRDFVAKQIKISDKIISKIEVVKAVKEVFIQKDETEYGTEWVFEYKDFSLDKIYTGKVTEAQVVNGIPKNIDYSAIRHEKEISEEEKDKFELLTKEKLEELLQPIMEKYFEKYSIATSIWKSDPNYLIQDEIQLKSFSEKPNEYPPLKNIFALAGYLKADDIKNKIDEIEKNSNYRQKLKKQLSESTTKYINEKWPEHKVCINVDISDELNIHVKVQDIDNTDTYYNMEERSQGFKQFISLLLSISATNKAKTISNNLILIDEPEVHLHPSGIRYMLKELLEIGENNYLFIATHSNFMLDRKTPERHFLISKSEGITNNKQITDKNLNDDELLRAAFGINVVRDFISPYKLLVEGESDKNLFYKCIENIIKNSGIIISNGKGNNIESNASFLAYSEVYPLVILDDDAEGKSIKPKIKKISKEFDDKVFTIRDLSSMIKDGATIEDTLPKDYIQSKINVELKKENLSEIILTDNSPFVNQLKLHLQKELSNEPDKKAAKKRIDNIIESIKTIISTDYNEKNISEKAPILFSLVKGILNKFGLDTEKMD